MGHRAAIRRPNSQVSQCHGFGLPRTYDPIFPEIHCSWDPSQCGKCLEWPSWQPLFTKFIRRRVVGAATCCHRLRCCSYHFWRPPVCRTSLHSPTSDPRPWWPSGLTPAARTGRTILAVVALDLHHASSVSCGQHGGVYGLRAPLRQHDHIRCRNVESRQVHVESVHQRYSLFLIWLSNVLGQTRGLTTSDELPTCKFCVILTTQVNQNRCLWQVRLGLKSGLERWRRSGYFYFISAQGFSYCFRSCVAYMVVILDRQSHPGTPLLLLQFVCF